MFSIKKNGCLILFVILTNPIFSQNNNSIELSGGVIFPMSSSDGFTGNFQFNYAITEDFYLYLSTGYSEWNNFRISIDYRYSENENTFYQQKRFISSVSADNHINIPFYLGTKLNFRTNKLFTSFMNFELGYSYFSFNSYNKWDPVYSNSGEVINYIPDEITKIKNKEHLFGIAIGLGASIPMTKDLNLIINYKVNTNTNFNNIALLNMRGIRSTLIGGVNLII